MEINSIVSIFEKVGVFGSVILFLVGFVFLFMKSGYFQVLEGNKALIDMYRKDKEDMTKKFMHSLDEAISSFKEAITVVQHNADKQTEYNTEVLKRLENNSELQFVVAKELKEIKDIFLAKKKGSSKNIEL